MAPVKPPAAKPSRRERAAETRRKMLDAAIACFTADGYDGTTMATIAEQAGVAVQTLYFSFHTKAQLLQETLERAVLGDGPPAPRRRPGGIRPCGRRWLPGPSSNCSPTSNR